MLGAVNNTDRIQLLFKEKYGRTYNHILERPDPVYCAISRLLETVLRVCEEHHIDVWLEFGTLLGHKRHGGILLWDSDAAVGMWTQDRHRFQEAMVQESASLVIDPHLYEHDGRGCWGVYEKKWVHETVLDIIWYDVDSDRGVIHSLQSTSTKQAYPSAYNYEMPLEHALPMQEVLLLGHRALVWASWEQVLTLEYGDWRQPLKDPSTWIVPRFHGPSIRPVEEYVGVHTVSEFLQLREQHVASDTPFILRDTRLWDLPAGVCYESLLACQESKVVTYAPTLESICSDMCLQEVFHQFLAGVLQTKVLDTPVHAFAQLMSTEWLEAAMSILGAEDVPSNALSWHIVASGISQWHADAVNDDHVRANAGLHSRKPGGWLKLYGGNKNIWFLPRTTWKRLLDEGTSPVSDTMRDIVVEWTDLTAQHMATTLTNTLGEMLHAEPDLLWGKLQVASVNACDLVWFPQSCLHKVSTIDKSYGFGGYI